MLIFYIVIYATFIDSYVIREIKNEIIFTSAFSVPVLVSKIWSSNVSITTAVTNHKNKDIREKQNIKIMFVRGLNFHLTDRLTNI